LTAAAGAAYSSAADGENLLRVPAGDYASTRLYTIESDGSSGERPTSGGWSLRIFPLSGN